ncbi:MAG TPA: SDR family NAD(P)-dependent oxidoreductase, partial [Solirubrobacterales bacterium]|nr:SDR family NAD(P)-dependent oxidoreductase [Solirubrobacterales bacterium]
EGEWSCHAQGTLSQQTPTAPEPLGEWPPPGATEIDVEDLYGRLAAYGLEYGDAFQGLSKAWRNGETVFAEVSLADAQREETARFGIHPALLDSALHGIALLGGDAGSGEAVSLPFAWGDVSLHATGATELRVRIAVDGEAAALSLADQSGMAVAEVGSLRLRPLDLSQLQGAGGRQDGLLGLEWRQVQLATDPVPFGEGDEAPEIVHFESPADSSLEPAEAARVNTQAALKLIQDWLSQESIPDSRLIVVTRGAVAAKEGESPDLTLAPIWGLMRSAQAENPDRFVLVDSDGSEASIEALPFVLALEEETQLALREGQALVPRAIPMPDPSAEDGDPGPALDPDSTVLVTGATGGLGALVARHLAAEHGARHLLLISRSGEGAEGAAELRTELEALGAEVRIEACDASSREQLSAAIDSIPTEHPLGAVVHSAGALDDGTIETLGPEQVERVFAPKADAAHHLHELSAGMDLSTFVMFSSLAGAMGNPGQANYAAANVFLDALAVKRHAEGLPATSIAWGLWEQSGGMASRLGEADVARMGRSGMAALSDEQGLELFDAALASGAPLALAAPFDRAGLGAMASAGMLPPLLRGLVRVPRRRRTASTGSLTAKLAALPEAERDGYVLELVRSETAAVLGHDSAAEIEPEKAFSDMGFDSLAAVELRNRLGALTGLRLPATLVFDYPYAAAIAGYLMTRVAPDGEAAERDQGEAEVREALARLETTLASVRADRQAREQVAGRLRSFLVALTDGGQPAADAPEEELESMSHEEVFELIDKEFGGDGSDE